MLRQLNLRFVRRKIGDRKKPSIYWRLVPYVEIWFENDVPVRVFVNDCEIHNFVLWVKHAIPS
jgi:hypothetical protein